MMQNEAKPKHCTKASHDSVRLKGHPMPGLSQNVNISVFIFGLTLDSCTIFVLLQSFFPATKQLHKK